VEGRDTPRSLGVHNFEPNNSYEGRWKWGTGRNHPGGKITVVWGPAYQSRVFGSPKLCGGGWFSVPVRTGFFSFAVFPTGWVQQGRLMRKDQLDFNKGFKKGGKQEINCNGAKKGDGVEGNIRLMNLGPVTQERVLDGRFILS